MARVNRLRKCMRLECLLFPVLLVSASLSLQAQSPPWLAGDSFSFRRVIDATSLKPFPKVIVAEFFTHGAMAADGANLAVYDSQGPVPMQRLQIGPGDYCRLAVQTKPGESRYYVYYGGSGVQSEIPPWTVKVGLVLETRHWKPCDLNQLESLRRAFAAAEPIGKDYVAQVFHAYNPLDPAPRPFLSHYSGVLRIEREGTYHFYTSSQDCSFLLIDGNVVVSAPGRHGPMRRARIGGTVTLKRGLHAFDYWHAAAGDAAVMVAAWQPPGASQVTAIPAEVFGNANVRRLPALYPEHRERRPIIDFMPRVLGEVMLEEASEPMIRVRFEDVVTRGLIGKAKVEWSFGDGQTFVGTGPEHIYLSPGDYEVSVTVDRKPPMRVVNHVRVGRPVVLPSRGRHPDTLERYVPLLLEYDPACLSARHLYQLVIALENAGRWKEAAAAAQAMFAGGRREEGDDEWRFRVAMRAGRLLRDELDDASAALALWKQAVDSIREGRPRALCALAAADTALHFTLTPEAAGPMLEIAKREASRGSLEKDELARYHRVRGDWHARHGRTREAQAEYRLAMEAKPLRGSVNEESARRGSYSRFVEAHLREHQWKEAREKLDAWLRDFPIERMEGYHSLLMARYWAAIDKVDRAIVTARDALAANPDSAYADRLLWEVAKWEEQRGMTERALAAYRSLIADYPGSPLVEQARKEVQRLESRTPSRGETEEDSRRETEKDSRRDAKSAEGVRRMWTESELVVRPRLRLPAKSLLCVFASWRESFCFAQRLA